MYRYASIFSLIALSVIQPLFDQYSKNMDFFVAWDISGFELFLIVVAVYLFFPALIVGGLAFAFIFNRRFGLGMECLLVVLFVTVLLMQVSRQVELDGIWIIFAATLASTIAAAIYFRYEIVKKYLAYFSVATGIFPLLFFQAVYSSGYFDTASGAIQYDNANLETPVVLIVYDELPLTTLLNSSGLIDEERFPEIGGLVKDSVWYINAVTRSGETNIAVPSIISGVKKEHGTPPKYSNYAINLFTLLGGSHGLNVIETMTSLCPPQLKCGQGIPTHTKVQGFVFDTFLIFSHITLPKSLASDLTPINFKTHDFGYTLEKTEDSVISAHKKFISMIREYSGRKPPLFFIHNVIPHVPWVYQPSGKRYTNSKSSELPGLNLAEERWRDNEWLVMQGYQRHILQTIYVDSMVGEIIGTLKSKGLYDESLIILTADHGVSFWASQSRRGVLENPESDIFNIPLFVKYPKNLNGGVVSYGDSSSIDILPTIADVLNVGIPFEVSGGSLQEKIQKRTFGFENKRIAEESLQRKLDLFGEGDINLIYKIGKHASLIGEKVSAEGRPSGLMGRVSLDDMVIFQDVNKDGPFIPSQIKGRISIRDERANYYLAIAVNDVICGVTEAYPTNGELQFSSIVSEDCFMSGKNDIKVFEISNDGSEVFLAFSDKGGGGIIGKYKDDLVILNNGEELHKSKLDGNIDIFSYDEKTRLLYVEGWAANLQRGLPVKYVLYKIDNAVYPVSSFRLKREDVADAFNNKELTNSGFSFYIPIKEISGREFDIIIADDGGRFDKLSAAKFSEKMSKRELKMFGLYGQSNGDGVKQLLSRIFGKAIPENDAESIGSYRSQGITLNDGKVLAESEPFQGHVDIFSFDIKSDVITVAGWSANVDMGEPAEYVLYRVDDKVFYGSPVSLGRPDVAKAYNKPSLEITGFGFSIPSSLISEGSIVEVIPVMPNGNYKRITTDKFASTFLEIER